MEFYPPSLSYWLRSKFQPGKPLQKSLRRRETIKAQKQQVPTGTSTPHRGTLAFKAITHDASVVALSPTIGISDSFKFIFGVVFPSHTKVVKCRSRRVKRSADKSCSGVRLDSMWDNQNWTDRGPCKVCVQVASDCSTSQRDSRILNLYLVINHLCKFFMEDLNEYQGDYLTQRRTKGKVKGPCSSHCPK